ncbi:MAG: HAD hydrolase family protein [Candidatus Bathyarchaeia archaeon]
MTVRATRSEKIFISDCEGPISKNDNAFELAGNLIPEGNHLFTLISRYDDVLADIVKREGYKAGDTLKLILPFLKAYDVKNQMMVDFSSRSILLMPGAKEMLEFVRAAMPAYIVSTSYEQYMRALCDIVGWPISNVYCTHLNLDKYTIIEEERAELKRLAEEMVELPMLEISKAARSLRDFPRRMQQTVQRLDEIFWKEISSMKIGRILREVNPVGGFEKATAIKDIVTRLKRQVETVMYVGDSITDVSAFQLVRDAGGLTIAFNSNSYAVREAEVAVLSDNAIVTAVLADLFSMLGKSRLLTLIRKWTPCTIEKSGISEPLKSRFLRVCRKKFPRVELITGRNMKKLVLESTESRKSVRGEAIGKLG